MPSLLTSKDMAYTFDFFKQAGEAGTVNGNSSFLGIPWGAFKIALGTGFAVKVNTGGAVDFYTKICCC
jgi:hypothetical protein